MYARAVFRSRLVLSVAVCALCAIGCDSTSDDDANPVVSTVGSGGGSTGMCNDSSRGTLQGTIYRFAPPGMMSSELATSAQARLGRMAGDTPIFVQTDDQAFFSVDLELGEWSVGADDPGDCSSAEDQSVSIKSCETTDITLVLDFCPG
jgi:hypothetical protein